MRDQNINFITGEEYIVLIFVGKYVSSKEPQN